MEAQAENNVKKIINKETKKRKEKNAYGAELNH